jgi:DHA2 family methylenomycin A resistance protein-like MFS transporter
VPLTTRQRGVLLAAAAATALTFFDQTATTAALRDVERDLHASVSELQWIMGAYLLALAALVPAAGRLADVYGRRRLFLVGVALFGVASVACAAAPSISALIALRALQGVGAALVVPLALANVAVVVPQERRGWAIGVLATGGSTFLSLGPLLGGLLVQAGGWRWVFAAGVPVAVLSLWAGSRWMEESRAPQRPALDGAGLLLLAAGLGALVVGLLQLTTWGATAPPTLAALGLGAVLLVAFAAVERRAAEPVVAVRLLRIPAVGGYLGALLAGQFAVTALTVELMLYLQRTLGYGALGAGLLFLPTVLATPLLSPAAGRLADRGRGRVAVSAGLLAAAVALVWIALFAGAERIWLLLPAFALFGLARPFVFTPSSTGPVAALEPRERGLAAALVTEAYQLGAVLGIAVAGTLVAAAEDAGDFVDGFQLAIALAGALCLAASLLTRTLLDPRRR